jgi:hypothetical protein
MFERVVFSRTPAGEAALARHDHGLPMALRRVLILVDGHSDGTALRAKAPYPDLETALEALLAQGLVGAPGQAAAAPRAPANDGTAGSSAAIRQALFELCREVLGDAKAEAVASRVLTAGDEPGAVAAAFAKTVSVVRLTVDEGKANEIKRRGEPLL